MISKKHFIFKTALLLPLIISATLYADDIYVVPKSDNPVDSEQYSSQVNLEANDTTNTYTPQAIPDNEGTEDPYTTRNVNENSIKSNIIQNNFVDVTVLKASPGNIANDTEDLLTGRESNIVNAPDSSGGQSGLSIKGNGDMTDIDD